MVLVSFCSVRYLKRHNVDAASVSPDFLEFHSFFVPASPIAWLFVSVSVSALVWNANVHTTMTMEDVGIEAFHPLLSSCEPAP